jgi:hypothetical protein
MEDRLKKEKEKPSLPRDLSQKDDVRLDLKANLTNQRRHFISTPNGACGAPFTEDDLDDYPMLKGGIKVA